MSHTEPAQGSTRGAGGRRVAESSASPRRFPRATVVGLALVVAAGLLATQVQSESVPPVAVPPESTALTRIDLACPQGRPGAQQVRVVSADRVGGELGLRRLPDSDAVGWSLPGPGLAARNIAKTSTIAAEGELAASLIAGRFGNVSATGCQAPSPTRWWTGLGARPEHNTIVELVNPDAGPAIADFRVISTTGEVEVDRLRGVRISPHARVALNLGRLVPRRSDLALAMSVSRGRVVASAWDQADELGRGAIAADWLPPQAEPTSTSTVLGLAPGAGSRTLVLANFGTSESRVRLQVVTAESTFSPEGGEEIVVPAGNVHQESLDALLGPQVADGALGVVVQASNPVAATVRSFVAGDLSHATPGTLVSSRAVSLLPAGGKTQIVFAGAPERGVARVITRNEAGQRLSSRRVALVPQVGARVDLPARAASVDVRVSKTSTAISVLNVRPAGASVLSLQELVDTFQVPAVDIDLP